MDGNFLRDTLQGDYFQRRFFPVLQVFSPCIGCPDVRAKFREAKYRVS